MNNLKTKDLLEFVVGIAILATIFHYLLSIPTIESLAVAVLLSVLVGLKYRWLEYRKMEYRETAEREFRKGYVLIVSICFILCTLGINHIFKIPLVKSALISIIPITLAYMTFHRIRSIGFAFETLYAVVTFLPAYLSEIDLAKSLAIGAFAYLLVQLYYHILSIQFTGKMLVFRLILTFLGVFYGFVTLVKANPILSILIASSFTYTIWLGCKIPPKIVDDAMKYRTKTYARIVLGAPGYAYRSIIGAMVIEGIYGTEYFAHWLCVTYRAYYIISAMLIIIEGLILAIYIMVTKFHTRS